MPSSVKSLQVTYNPVNDDDTFTSGDVVTGQVTLEVVKDFHIESLMIKFKGKARVMWTERHGQTTVVYHSKDKYFSLKHYFVGEAKGEDDNRAILTHRHGDTYSNVVGPGCHVYPFTFQFPYQDMPSSFQTFAGTGKIVYLLEARLGRSLIDKTETAKLNFVSKAHTLSIDPALMRPQHETKDKKMKFFNSGTVAMDVTLQKSGFFQGEGINVVAYIQNNSTRNIKPKYCVYSKHSFFAKGKRRLHTKDLLKEEGEPIPPSSSVKVARVINIPHDFETSILNCSIIKVEHRLRVYLDVKYASDPEIKFPIVIMLASRVATAAPQPPASGFRFESFGNRNPPPWGMAPPPPPPAAAAAHSLDPPPAYGTHEMYPPLYNFDNKYK